MADIRKKILRKVEKRNIGTTNPPSYPSKFQNICSPASKDPHEVLSDIENFISEVCKYIEADKDIPDWMQDKSEYAKRQLDLCFKELPNFSQDFYGILLNILNSVRLIKEDCSIIAKHLVSLADFLQSSNIKLNRIQKLANGISSSVIQYILCRSSQEVSRAKNLLRLFP